MNAPGILSGHQETSSANDIQNLKKAAESSEVNAQFALAEYYSEEQIPISQKQAIEFYKHAADQGHQEAIKILAHRLSNTDQWIHYLKMAADLGDPQAQADMGINYLSRTSPLGYSKEQGLKYLKLAADQGYVSALLELYQLYRDGTEVEQSSEESLRYLILAAEKEHRYHQKYRQIEVFKTLTAGKEKYDSEALHWLEKAAEQGEERAYFALAYFYSFGVDVEKSKEKADSYIDQIAKDRFAYKKFHFYKPIISQEQSERVIQLTFEYIKNSADQGNAEAQNLLGDCYKFGFRIGQSDDQALHYFKLAADQGLAKAQFNVGSCFLGGKGVEKSVPQALNYFSLAANQSDIEALNRLAFCYQQGIGVTPSNQKAFEYFKRAADLGDSSAQYVVGRCFAYGQGTVPSDAEAFHYFQLASGTDFECSEKLVSPYEKLAECYFYGKGVPRSLEKAYHYFKLAAKPGNWQAAWNVGVCLLKGYGCEKSLEKALEYFNLSSKWLDDTLNKLFFRNSIARPSERYQPFKKMIYELHISDNIDGITNKFDILANNKDFEVPVRELFRLNMLLADQGDAKGQFQAGEYASYLKEFYETEFGSFFIKLAADQRYAQAQYHMGIGPAIDGNKSEALFYYELAAQQGYVPAIIAIGDFYRIYYQSEIEKAEAYYKLAAAKGDVESLVDLALMNKLGCGVPQSYEEAFEYYKQAAEKGHAEALYEVGIMYFEGCGTKRHFKRSLHYLTLAAQQNYERAFKKIEEVKSYLEQDIDENQDDFFYRKLEADLGNAGAQWIVGGSYLRGINVEKSIEKGLYYLNLSASQGYCFALNDLGHIYDWGHDVEPSPEKAFDYYKKAADLNDPRAITEIAARYFMGIGTKVSFKDAIIHIAKAFDYISCKNGKPKISFGRDQFFGAKEAFRLFKIYADESEDPKFQCLIADAYHHGIGTPISLEQAFHYYFLGAKGGIIEGEFQAIKGLGDCYFYGKGSEQSFEEACRCYKLVANSDNPRDVVKVAICYLEDKKLQKESEADLWLWRAAEIQFPPAQAKLGDQFLDKGETDKAISYYRPAAANGLIDAKIKLAKLYDEGFAAYDSETQAFNDFCELVNLGILSSYRLGEFYEFGKGTSPSIDRAIENYKLAAEKGCIPAILKLACFYFSGYGLEQSKEKAVDLFHQLASQGYAPSQFYLALCYAKGCVVEQSVDAAERYYSECAKHMTIQDRLQGWVYQCGINKELPIDQAFDCMKQCADQGNVLAQKETAKCYSQHKIVPPSQELGFHYWKLAADQGDLEAQEEVSECYYYGKGVEKSLNEALKYFKIAHHHRALLLSEQQSEKVRISEVKLPNTIDEKFARSFLTEFANQENPFAQYFLAKFYSTTPTTWFLHNWPIINSEYAYHYYILSAQRGYAKAHKILGDYFYELKDLKNESLTKALEHYKQAAQSGDVEAQFCLAQLFLNKVIVSYADQNVIRYINMAADEGYGPAQNQLGELYYEGKIVTKSYDTAFSLFILAANQGIAKAQMNVAICFEEGCGSTERSYEKAFYYLQLAADNGYTPAMFRLGGYYENGHGVPQSFSEALKCYESAVNLGYDEGLCKVGEFYLQGKGASQSREKAVEYFRQAANLRQPGGQFYLGLCYANGWGVETSYEDAVKNYQLASEQGHLGATTNLGHCYASGRGVTQSYEQAISLYKTASEKGGLCALTNLANLYYYGHGLEPSVDVAIQHLEKAASKGYARAQYLLGCYYARGDRIIRDEVKAFNYYQQAALQGYEDAEAQLGWCYETGTGVAKDLKQAVRFYQQAADKGSEIGAQYLGCCYEEGIGIERSPENAFYYFNQAAQKNSAFGQNKVAWCFENGIGVEKNEAEAFKYYSLAAEQKFAGGLYHVGWCYELGMGVSKDEKIAFSYYLQAAEKGSKAAVQKVAKCFRDGTGVEKSEEQFKRYSNLYIWMDAESEEIIFPDKPNQDA